MPSISGFSRLAYIAKRIAPRAKQIRVIYKQNKAAGFIDASRAVKQGKEQIYRFFLFNHTGNGLKRRIENDAVRIQELLSGKKPSVFKTAKGVWNHVVGYKDIIVDTCKLPFRFFGQLINDARKTSNYAKRFQTFVKNKFSKAKPDVPKLLTTPTHNGDILVLRNS